MQLLVLTKEKEESALHENRLTIAGLIVLGLPAILFLDHLFTPALINLLESLTGKFPHIEIVMRMHFLFVFFQILLILFYLLFIRPAGNFKTRILLYLFLAESIVLCAIWIFDKPDNYFYTERSALTFFSAVFLLLCSLTAFLNGLFLRYRSEPIRSSGAARVFWHIIAAAFLFAAVDEFFMIHEKVSGILVEGNWLNDMVTALYPLGALVFVGIFFRAFKNLGFTWKGHFPRIMAAAIAVLAMAVLADTFDILFRPLNRYFNTFYLINSIEELLEFTAATLFLCAFVVNLLETDDNQFLKLLQPETRKREPGRLLRAGYTGFALVSILALIGVRVAYPVTDGPIVAENGFRVSIVAGPSQGVNSPDGLAYDRELGLFVGNGGKVNNILVFDKDGQGRVFADPTTGLVSPEALVVWNKALYVSDDSGGKILKYDVAGAAPTVAAEEGLKSPDALALDFQGNLYIGDERLSLLIKQTGDHKEVLASALDGLKTPEEIAIDDRDNLYVTDEGARAVFKISASGETTVFADKSDGLLSPEGITFHRGKIYVSDSEAGVIYRYDQQGKGEKLLTFSRKYRRLAGITFDEQDAMYVIAADPYSSTGFVLRIVQGD